MRAKLGKKKTPKTKGQKGFLSGSSSSSSGLMFVPGAQRRAQSSFRNGDRRAHRVSVKNARPRVPKRRPRKSYLKEKEKEKKSKNKKELY
jgi:hypothetical protein